MRPRTRRVVLVVGLLLVMLSLPAVVHLVAGGSLARSRDTALPLADRLQYARGAARIEPWRMEAASQAALIEGTILYERGDLDAAKRVLGEARLKDLSDKPLESLLRTVNLEIIARDSRKAHQQHGHEGPGGTLRPEDVER